MKTLITLLLALLPSIANAARTQYFDADHYNFGNMGILTKQELYRLQGITSNIQGQLDTKALDTEVVKLTGDQSVAGAKTFTGKTVASSTANGFHPCPSMTEAQRNAVSSPTSGDCVYNTTTGSLNVYNGTAWKSAGGGLNSWESGFAYQVGDVIYNSVDEIYRASVGHTSGSFTTDLASGYWVRLSSRFVTGGTSDSAFEVSTLKAPHSQMTLIDTDVAMIETGNGNILINPGFEASSGYPGWSTSTGSASVVNAGMHSGSKGITFSPSVDTRSLYQDVSTNAGNLAGSQMIAWAWVKSYDVSSAQVCARVNGVPTACSTSVPMDGLWHLRSVPFVAGSTSSGVSITNGSSATGTIYADSAGVSPFSPSLIGSINNNRLGYIKYVATSGCSWSGTSGTVASFSADSDCPVAAAYGSTVASPSTKKPAITVKKGEGPRIRFSTTGSFYGTKASGTSATCAWELYNGTTRIPLGYGGIAGATGSIQGFDNQMTAMYESPSGQPLAADTEFEIRYVAITSATTTCGIVADSTNLMDLTISAETISDSGSFVSAQNENYGPINYTPTITATSGTLTNYTATATHQRIGNIMRVDGSITFSGAPGTWDIPLVTYPSTCTVDKPAYFTTIRSSGTLRDVSASASYTLLHAINSAYSGVAILQGSFSGFSSTSPVTVASGDVVRFGFDLVCSNWTNPSIAVIPLQNTPRTPGVTLPKKIKFAFGGTSATLASPTECAASPCVEVYDPATAVTPPTRSGTGVYADLIIADATFKASSPVECSCRAYDVTSGQERTCIPYFITGDGTWASNANGGYVMNIVVTNQSSSPSTQDAYVIGHCEGEYP